MTTPRAPQPSRKDRTIAKLAALLAGALYRDIDVHWATPPLTDGPELSLSNHFGGLSDGIVLVHTLPRRPGIIARDVIWKIPFAGWVMNWIGGIPVHQPQDGRGSSNDQMFASCYRALADDRHLLIFPEGITRDEPSIGRVKTGAARIALGARTAGVEGLTVTPVGIHYEDKAALRSRAVVIGGVPVDIDSIDDEAGADDREAVDRLTERFDTELRRAAPDYADWAEARALQSAAEITIRDLQDVDDLDVPIGQRDRLANALADRPAADRAAICAAVEAYQDNLDGLGLDDAGFRSRSNTGAVRTSLWLQLSAVVALFPFAVVGAFLNLVPFLIIKAIGLLRISPAVMASLKPAVAMLAFGVTWGIEVWAAGRSLGVTGIAAAIVLIPAYSIAVVVVAERATLLWRLRRRRRTAARANGLTDQLTGDRKAVIEAVLGS